MKIKKILFIVNSFPSNEFPHHGTFNFKAVEEISKKLPVQVIHLRSNNFKRPLFKKREFNGIDVIEISIFYYNSLSNRFTAFNIDIYKRIANQLLRKQFDKNTIIHSVGVVLSGQVGAYISKKNNLKHIAQAIGSDMNFILPELKNYYGVKSWDKNTNIIACNSRALEKEVKKNYPDTVTKVIYRGVDLKQYTFKETPKTNKFNYLYLGGLSIIKTKLLFNREHPIKAFDNLGEDTKGGVLLLKAWKSWKNSSNNQDAVLYFGGPTTSVEKINRILEGDYKEFNIVFIGTLNKNEVIERIIESHVTIVPSYAEGLPNVAMESFSIGRPVIGTNVGGIPELIDHKKTGYLFGKGDIDGLIRALDFYYYKKDDIKLLGKKARAKVEKDFNSVQFSNAYIKLYNEN